MAAPRIRRVYTEREMQSVRDDFMTQGFEVLREGEGTILMRQKSWGTTGMHIVIGLLTVWWTVGIANLLYALYAHNSADQVMLKLEPKDPVEASPGS